MTKQDKKTESQKAVTEQYSVYTRNGVIYVPHYLDENVFVGPAYNITKEAYSGSFLARHGAKKETMYLWKRGTYGNVENVNV
jgi:hypothetical protein